MKPHFLAVGAFVFGALLSAPQPGSCLAASPNIGLSATPTVTYDSVDPTPSDGFIVEPTVDETDPSTPPDGSSSDPAENNSTDPSDGFIVEPIVDETDPTAPPVTDPGNGSIVEPTVD